jgi:glycosyltransferase involved in cell wall biosynthesis
MALIRIISRDNGVGLSRDMRLLAEVLASTDDCRVELLGFGSNNFGNRLREIWLRLSQLWRGQADVQLFVERVYCRCLAAGRSNLLVPNPEWFLAKWLPLLPHFDRVLCKTHEAQQLFAAVGCVSEYIGFSSDDRYQPQVWRQRAFFHLAGRSSAKGTQQLLEAWLRHPEWPQLTVVQSEKKAQPVSAANIVQLTGYVDEVELLRLQNLHQFHMCPSRAEGFGHYIVEGMSVGAVVLTTDGAPMNELVGPDRGLLIEPYGSEPDNLGTRYHVDAVAIERAVEQALSLSAQQLEALSQAARAHFLEQRTLFQQRLRTVIAEACSGAGRKETASPELGVRPH